MEILVPLIQVLGGLAVLVVGGELLVRGAVAAANILAVPPLIIGLTIVSFGTSAPELVISVQAVLEGHPDIALGNIIGSNIANILLILGVAATIFPIDVDRKLIKRDIPLLALTSVLLLAFCYNGTLDRAEGMSFLIILGSYTFYVYWASRQGTDKALEQEADEETRIRMSLGKTCAFVAAGLALLVIGSNVLVEGAVTLARSAGVSEAIIGLTILAIGSSAPELITSVVAAMRKHGDLALGNVVGSNIFNVTCIGGFSAVIMPIEVAHRFLSQDLPFMLAATGMLAMFVLTGSKMVRKEGIVLLSAYALYTAWLTISVKL